VHPINSFLLESLLAHTDWVSHDQAKSLLHTLGEEVSGDALESGVYSALVEQTGISEAKLNRFIADAEGIEVFGEHSQLSLDRTIDVAQRVGATFFEKNQCVPFDSTDGVLKIASVYPCRYEEIEGVAHMTQLSIEIHIASPAEVSALFDQVFSEHRSQTTAKTLQSQLRFSASEFSVPSEASLNEDVDEGAIRQYVDWVVREAIVKRASDIHFEPMEQHFKIRCRVDGVLQVLDDPVKSIQNSVLSRVKLMSGIDIAEKRLPQDGRFHLEANGRGYDFRVSTVPSTHGEGIVIRILDKERLNIGLPELGMLPKHQAVFERVIADPDGIFLVTGPTGSGKSTTLYAALNYINDPGVKIITVEDPVEYHIAGINQVQVRPEVDMTFSAALRSILRQAPNIIMVGEIRDRETAEIAINASLTGHTVFSTLHTNDAPSAITRLIDMGAKPFLVAAALRAVLAQRLVRKIAEGSRVPFTISDWQIEALGGAFEHLKGKEFFHAGENRSSYRGRLGVFELFEVDEGLGDVVYRDPTLTNIKRHLSERNFENMRWDGVLKALKGWTTLDEVMANTVENNLS
jgi:type IV pilus assembly protein PilB